MGAPALWWVSERNATGLKQHYTLHPLLRAEKMKLKSSGNWGGKGRGSPSRGPNRDRHEHCVWWWGAGGGAAGTKGNGSGTVRPYKCDWTVEGMSQIFHLGYCIEQEKPLCKRSCSFSFFVLLMPLWQAGWVNYFYILSPVGKINQTWIQFTPMVCFNAFTLLLLTNPNQFSRD